MSHSESASGLRLAYEKRRILVQRPKNKVAEKARKGTSHDLPVFGSYSVPEFAMRHSAACFRRYQAERSNTLKAK